MDQTYDSEKLTDMEIALSLLKLMEEFELKSAQRTSNFKATFIRMVESAVETLSNPFAKNLLMAKLAEQE